MDRERESIFLVGNQLFETIDRLDRGGKQDDSFYLPLSRANAFVPAAIAAAQKGESERQRERALTVLDFTHASFTMPDFNT